MQNFNTMSNEQFVDFLFGKLVQHVDIEEIDLHDDDSCDDHLQFEQLCLFWIMNTNTQTYLVRLYDQFTMMQVTRTMPTTPTTSKGIKAQQNRVLKWAEKTYPNQIRYEIEPLKAK